MAKRRPRFDSLESRLCLTGLPIQTSFSLPVGSWTATVYRASPLFVDIFGTGKDDLIAVASGAQLIAYAENADGSASPVVTYKVPDGVADIKSTPVVVTDPRSGRKDLFAAMGRDEHDNGGLEDGRVFGWDLQTGNLLPGWTQGVSTGHNPLGYSGAYGAITSGDLQGTGVPDIVVTSFSHEVSAYTLDGATLWQWDNDDTNASGAVIADIDRDGKPEVIVGGDSSYNIYFQQGGWINVLSNTGTLKWRRQIVGEVTWSSPVVADLLNNGYLDVVIGTGDNFSFNEGMVSAAAGAAATEAGDYIYAYDPFGNPLPGWPYHTAPNGDAIGHEVLAAPAVDDLLGNGQLEVIALDRAGYIHVIQPNGQDLPGFVGGKALVPERAEGSLPDDYGSPVIADVNGDGKPDIIAGNGPFVRAFDTSGNLIPLVTTPNASDGLFEGIDIAPAIGNFDGTGGLTMAVVTFDADNSNRPDKVTIYRLPASTLAPPWPFLRRTVTGDAVMRSSVYDQQYVVSTFNALMGSKPDAPSTQLYVDALNSDAINLLMAAQSIASTLAVRQSEVSRIYQEFLAHAPDAYALNYWSNFLATSSYRQMEILVAQSQEFAQRAGNSLPQEIVQLYQGILARTPSQSEVANWYNSGLPIGTITGLILNSAEALRDQLNIVVQAGFGAGTQNLLPADAAATYSLDIHQGMSEASADSLLLASNANLASTNLVAGYARDLYLDIFLRVPSASEIAYWVNAVDTGAVPLANMASYFLTSLEAREDFVQSEYLSLLGHFADSASLMALSNYTNRESVIVFLISSPEYFARSGGTDAGFVVSAFQSLAGIGISQASINSFVAELDSGTSRAAVAQQIIYGGSLYFYYLTVNQLYYYVPLESQGVLRSGELPPTAAGQPINPDPNLINYFESMYLNGASDEQVLSAILNSPQYGNKVAYEKGIKRTPGVRY